MGSRLKANVSDSVLTCHRPPVVRGRYLVKDQDEQEKGLVSSSYLSMESILVLLGLTAGLIILPLVLPPFPPPPSLLLLVPVGLLGLLLVLAFMPSGSNVRDLTYM